MPCHRSRVAAVLLFVSVFAAAQNAARPVGLRLFLPPNVPSEKVAIRYYLYGSFGGYGSFVTPEPNSQSIKIPLAVEGKPAAEVKAFMWAPGCRIATLDLKVEALDIQETYSCDALRSISLTGQIEESSFMREQHAELRVDYVAEWTCEFFGLPDCMVPQVSLGVFKLDTAGRFEIQLPDFASDPISSGSKIPSNFQLVVRESKTWNLIAFLDPVSNDLRAGGGLKPTSSYRDPVVFALRKAK